MATAVQSHAPSFTLYNAENRATYRSFFHYAGPDVPCPVSYEVEVELDLAQSSDAHNLSITEAVKCKAAQHGIVCCDVVFFRLGKG